MRTVIPILCVFILSFHSVRASEDDKEKAIAQEWKIGGAVHVGKGIKHTTLMDPIIERSAVGGEIFLSKQTYGAYRWNAFFNYPEYGISYTFFDLGSPDYAGTAHCLFPYLNFHFFNNQSRMNLNLRTGVGLAYVEKIYDAETNPENFAFSTHLNIVLNAQLQGVYKMSNAWSLSAGVGIIHFSNGAYRMPNLGMNTVSLFTGVSRSFGKGNRYIASENKTNEKNKNWACTVFLLGGVKEINPIGGKKYFAGDFNVEITKKHLQYTRFGVSMDVTYDTSEYDCIIFQALPPVDRLKTTRIGISGGYEWLFGDFSLDLFLGTYLHESNPLYGRIYQRSSLRYPLSDRVKLSVTFRNHKGKADYIGLGFGYRLTK
ncbi:MAG: acyloxyacyl hydrolase [Candidatus Azobacteroides sp.]|nr:acyloxyacyl hydrolase [Candidatus Azobacteroides sp.]